MMGQGFGEAIADGCARQLIVLGVVIVLLIAGAFALGRCTASTLKFQSPITTKP